MFFPPKSSLLFKTIAVFVTLSLLQVVFSLFASGLRVPGNSIGEFSLRKLIAVFLLLAFVYYAGKLYAPLKAWWSTNPRIRLLFQPPSKSSQVEQETAPKESQ